MEAWDAYSNQFILQQLGGSPALHSAIDSIELQRAWWLQKVTNMTGIVYINIYDEPDFYRS